ncbi:MAG: hypothetical protein AUK53_11795 [Betaproteobacteria bacterium CG2_30_59_46]|nr:MAG: hypothetical protein AUK53_11795 [Betaproteobacteria bacterium CG2_30_59_46]
MNKINENRFPGDRIKEERLRLGIKSQAAAAAKFGVERETWSRYETGKIEMGRDVFRHFVDAGADAGYIATGVRRGEEHATTAAQKMRVSMLASLLGDELQRAGTGLKYEVFYAVLTGLVQDYGDAPNFDVDAARAEIAALLGRKS